MYVYFFRDYFNFMFVTPEQYFRNNLHFLMVLVDYSGSADYYFYYSSVVCGFLLQIQAHSNGETKLWISLCYSHFTFEFRQTYILRTYDTA